MNFSTSNDQLINNITCNNLECRNKLTVKGNIQARSIRVNSTFKAPNVRANSSIGAPFVLADNSVEAPIIFGSDKVQAINKVQTPTVVSSIVITGSVAIGNPISIDNSGKYVIAPTKIAADPTKSVVGVAQTSGTNSSIDMAISGKLVLLADNNINPGDIVGMSGSTTSGRVVKQTLASVPGFAVALQSATAGNTFNAQFLK